MVFFFFKKKKKLGLDLKDSKKYKLELNEGVWLVTVHNYIQSFVDNLRN